MIECTVLRCSALFLAIPLLLASPCLAQFGQQLSEDQENDQAVIPIVLSIDDPDQSGQPQPTLETVFQQLQRAEARIAELELLTTTIDHRILTELDGINTAKPSGDNDSTVEPQPAIESSPSSTRTFYSSDGFGIETDDNRFSVAIQNRIQARYSNPFDSDPRTLNALQQNESSFMIRRARTKVRGNAYHPWLEFYLQYDWADPILRDLSLTISKYKWATLEIGRAKVLYNDERKTSSANQQFVNRSIVNDIFTVDRQQGVQLYGNVLAETPIDTTYYLGVFTGRGVGVRNNDDDHLMYNARLQWNALGGEIPFSQSDVGYSSRPALNFAVAANTNRSSCLAFETSQNSCRALPWAPYDTIGEPGQYRINQMMGEVRFKWVGFSLLHELHVKEINDKFADASDPFKQTTMLGGFIQAGYFPHTDIPEIPKEVEVAGRYAVVDPKLAINNIRQYESSGVVTYFLNGHRNKINLQLSHLTLAPDNIGSRSQQRLWVQWDLSF
jgi:phosphate-selective porin OprO/OprP